MTSGTSSTEELKKAIEKDGFFYEIDSIIGKRVDEFAKKGYPFKTEEGLDFCKLNTLDDKVSRQFTFGDARSLIYYSVFQRCLNHFSHGQPSDSLRHTVQIHSAYAAFSTLEKRLGFKPLLFSYGVAGHKPYSTSTHTFNRWSERLQRTVY
jgi:hypothetical protein